jgi:hypothetical protein
MLIITETICERTGNVVILGTVKNEVELREFIQRKHPSIRAQYQFTDDGIGVEVYKENKTIHYEGIYAKSLINSKPDGYKLTKHAIDF